MARPPSLRRVGLGFETRLFKPAGTPMRQLPIVHLDLDGLEAMRLADHEGLYQEAAAERMGVSRATFGRILTTARARVAEALLTGKALRIGGGAVVEGEPDRWPCPVHGGGRRRGRGCRCHAGWDQSGAGDGESGEDEPSAGGGHARDGT